MKTFIKIVRGCKAGADKAHAYLRAIVALEIVTDPECSEAMREIVVNRYSDREILDLIQ